MSDFRPLDHSLEKNLSFTIRQELIDEVDEGLVDVVLWDGSTNTVDIGDCHEGHLAARNPDGEYAMSHA
jgi:hypothetical protein